MAKEQGLTRRIFMGGLLASEAVRSSYTFTIAGTSRGKLETDDNKTDRPNILIIMTDQHSSHFLGCYGNSLVRTPNLDALAAGGIRFDNCYCPGPLCVPSRMSFMTGRTPSNNQVWDNTHILNSGIPTWAHALGLAGYRTSLIGRMHFQGPDQHHGFEEHFIGSLSAGHPGSRASGGPAWTKYPRGTAGQSRKSVEYSGKGSTFYQWYDEVVTKKACEYLEESACRNDSRPFAAVVGYLLPHCPFIAPKELFDYYYEKVEVPPVEDDQPESIKRFRQSRGIIAPDVADENKKVAIAAYYALCEHIDSMIGKIVTKLTKTGLSKNTLVIYCSDHGEMAGEHGCWWKSNYYEGSVKVPLIASMPGLIDKGSSSQAICNLYDIAPTLTELAGIEVDYDFDGKSLLPVMTGSCPDASYNETYSELCDMRLAPTQFILPSKMVRSGKWKMWVYNDKDLPPALFDLENDPNELNDLGSDPAYEDIRRQLLTKIQNNWDPEMVSKLSHRYCLDYLRIANWTKQTNPPSLCSLELPPAEYESDVELINQPRKTKKTKEN